MHIFDGFLNYKLYFCGFFVSLEKVKKIHQNKNPNFFILAFWVKKKNQNYFEVFRFFIFFCGIYGFCDGFERQDFCFVWRLPKVLQKRFIASKRILSFLERRIPNSFLVCSRVDHHSHKSRHTMTSKAWNWAEKKPEIAFHLAKDYNWTF